MSKPKSRKHVEEYDSDNGFVEDAPKSKKQKSEPKEKKAVRHAVQKDDEGNEYWELSGRRRIQISQFKNMTMVGIREFYEKDGKMLPGKKGISLNVEQYTALVELLPDIERVLESKGITVPHPQYDKTVPPEHEDTEEQEDEAPDEEDDEEAESAGHRGKLDKFKMRRNHEATSDEDEG